MNYIMPAEKKMKTMEQKNIGDFQLLANEAIPEGMPAQTSKIPKDNDGTRHLLLRSEGRSICQMIDGISQSREFDKEVISGAGGVGKSTALFQGVVYARRNDWLVFYIMQAKSICKNTDQTPGEVAQELLIQHLQSSGELLTQKQIMIVNFALKHKYTTDQVPNPTILTIAQAGAIDPTNAVECLRHYISELRAVTDVPVLIAVDQWNSFHAPGKILVSRIPKQVVYYDLMDENDPNNCINEIASIFSNFNKFVMARGLFLVAISSAFNAGIVMEDGFDAHQINLSAWSNEEFNFLRRILDPHKLLSEDDWDKLIYLTGPFPRYVVVFYSLFHQTGNAQAALQKLEMFMENYYEERIKRLMSRVNRSADEQIDDAVILEHFWHNDDHKVRELPPPWKYSGIFLESSTPQGFTYFSPVNGILRRAIINYMRLNGNALVDMLAVRQGSRGECLQVLVERHFLHKQEMKLSGTTLDGKAPWVVDLKWIPELLFVVYREGDPVPDLKPGSVVLFFGNFPTIDFLVCNLNDGILYLIQLSKSDYPQHKSFRALVSDHQIYDQDMLSHFRNKCGFKDERRSRTEKDRLAKDLPQDTRCVYLTTSLKPSYNPQHTHPFYHQILYVSRQGFLQAFDFTRFAGLFQVLTQNGGQDAF